MGMIIDWVILILLLDQSDASKLSLNMRIYQRRGEYEANPLILVLSSLPGHRPISLDPPLCS